MRARTTNGDGLELAPEALAALRSRLRGRLLSSDEPADGAAYDESRRLWNAMIDRRPAAVASCLGAGDIVECVRFARERDLLLSVKSGGHNIAGLAVADGALMLDLSAMRGVWVDAAARVAHAQAGCLLGDIDRETQLHGLATVLGFVSQTGAAGLTLGGGFGFLTRRWGWTSDNVVGMNLVTADARVVRASEGENADLFWALRGGGGNFGVVTGIDYRLHPVGPEIVGGVVAWPASEAPKVLELYREMAADAAPELTLVTILRPAPPAPWLPKEAHGQPMVAIVACHSGDVEAAERAVAPIKSFGRPIGDILIRRPPHSAIILFQIGGALNQLAADHSPVGNRDARVVLNVASSWEKPADDDANIDWTRGVWSDLRRYSTGGTYINFLTEEEGPERTAAALGGALERLAAVKAKWDPQNVFRTNRNIAPAS